MKELIWAVVAGIIIMVTQSGSVMVVGELSVLENGSGSSGPILPMNEAFTRHAVAPRGADAEVIRWDYPSRSVIGPRRGPVK